MCVCGLRVPLNLWVVGVCKIILIRIQKEKERSNGFIHVIHHFVTQIIPTSSKRERERWRPDSSTSTERQRGAHRHRSNVKIIEDGKKRSAHKRHKQHHKEQ